MWKKILTVLMMMLQKADIEMHWRGGESDEFRVIVKWNQRILLDRTFDVIRS